MDESTQSTEFRSASEPEDAELSPEALEGIAGGMVGTGGATPVAGGTVGFMPTTVLGEPEASVVDQRAYQDSNLNGEGLLAGIIRDLNAQLKTVRNNVR